MRIISLKLKNFKGLSDFVLDVQGKDARVFGDNATGKTTLFDAFTWLLFDKDSQDQAGFEIKTLNPNGTPMHGLSHTVEGVFEIDGKTVTLAKSYEEKWTKKRGSASKEFTGHTTSYYLNGVPVKKSEFTSFVSQIVDEKIFKLLTNPVHFNTQLHWQERRKILLDVCGDISDAEVIASNESLAKLPLILGERKLEDHRKVIAARRAEINKELDRIPVRIDEATRALPDITGIDVDALQSEIDLKQGAVAQKRDQISRIKSGGEAAEKTKQLRQVEGELLDIRNRHRARYEDDIQAKQNELSTERTKVADLKEEIRGLERTEEANSSKIAELKGHMDQLRVQWEEKNATQFTFEESDTCPTCGQALPAERIEEARETARAQFNQQKALRLSEISAEGKQLKTQAEGLTTSNAELEEKIVDAESRLHEAELAVKEITSELDQLREAADAYADSPAYVATQKKLNVLQKAIDSLNAGRQDEIKGITQQIAALESEIDAAEAKVADVVRNTKGQERINELKAQERKLAAEYERLEEELYLTEEFVRAKVAALEEKINSRFKLARFKLFDTQINGGLTEVCEATCGGVPYGSGLNNAMRINVGLDIINTLSEHYGFAAPVFVDNAEAVTELMDTDTQVISLIVSQPDKKLRVETEGGMSANQRGLFDAIAV